MVNKIGNIAVLCDWCRGPYQEKLFSGILAAADKYDKKCFFFAGRKLKAPDSEDLYQNRIYQLIRPDDYEGIILTGLLADYCTQKEFLDFAISYNSCSLVSVEYKLPGYSAVLCDDKSSIAGLVAHLVSDHHYHHFIVVTGPRDNYCSRNRLSLIKKQLEKHTILLEPASILEGDYSYISGRSAAKKLLHKLKKGFHKKIDVIMAFNDLMAAGIIDELGENKIRVPQDVAVTGFDNLDDASTNVPGITTIDQPIYDLGYFALQSLATDKAPENQDIFLKSKLIIRGSCGCPEQGSNKSLVEQ
ncbi:MAG: LacI family DNA-binding transcriptional regulator [Spirochaetales bacterium]|nr:LacI family DNA-binding transcriptional regulator [Spirochaetales bacterium]